MQRSILVLGAITVSCLAGHARALDEGEDSRPRRAAIVGGSLSDHRNVVYLRSGVDLDGIEPRACTGTFVAENLVLTARHCVSYFEEGDFYCTVDGGIDGARPRRPENAGEVGLLYAARQIELFLSPGPSPSAESPDLIALRVFAPETNTICRNDIALVLVELSEDARERGVELGSIQPSAIRLSAGVSMGEPVRLVGYGTNDHGLDRQEELEPTPILAIGPSEFFPEKGLALPRTFVVGRGPCPGDSGGPAFSVETGALLGVYSIFRGRCDSKEARNFYTQAAPFHAFIEGVFDAVEQPIRLEDRGASGGDSSASGGSGAGGASPLGGEGGMMAEEPQKGGCSLAPGVSRLYGWPSFVTILGTAWLCFWRRRGSINVERS